jgi:hypothetical protein
MPRSHLFVCVLLALGVGGAGCSPPNHQPIITAGPRPLGSPSTPGGLTFVEGTEIQLQLEVVDQDQDEIFFKWSQIPAEPAGRFSSTSIATPTWTVPRPQDDPKHAFHLYVEVQDGNGGILLGQSPPIFVQPK